MILDELTIKNFGPHKELSIKTHGDAVFGVLGPNGSGKSNIRDALRFAISGSLPRKASTYMTKGAKGSTTVECRFRKGGVPYRIQRTITATTSSRKLWLPDTPQDKPITAAAQVDEIMAGLLGIDKRAAIEAVFVPQGEIQDLLFGDVTTRETSFQRMIGCSHFAAVSQAAQSQAAILKGTITDVSGQISTETVALNDLIERHQKTLAEVPLDCGPMLSAWVEKRRVLDLQSSLTARMDVLRTQLAQHGPAHEIPGLLENLEHQLLTCLEAGKKAQTDDAQDRAELQFTRDALTHRAGLDKATQDLSHAQAALATRQDRSSDLAQCRQSYANKQRELQDLQKLKSQRDAAEQDVRIKSEQLTQYQNKLAELQPQLTHHESVLAQLPDPAPLLQQLAEVQTTLNLFHALQKSIHTGTGVCPVCESTSSAMTPEAVRIKIGALETQVADLRMQTSQIHSQATASRDTIQRLTTAVQQTTSHLQVLQQLLPTLQERLASLPVPGTLQQVEQELAALLAEGHKLHDQQVQYTAAAAAVVDCQAVHARYAHQACAFSSLANTTVEVLTARVSELENNIAGRTTQIQADSALAEQHRLRIQSIKRLVHDIQAAEQGMPTNVPTETLADVQARIESLQHQQTQRETKLAEAREQERSIKLAQDRLQALQDQQAKDAAKTAVLQDLQIVQELFSRQGIARDYGRDVFGDALILTQEILGRMGADFTIRPADGIMAFEFCRAGSTHWHSQNLMSGGQQVRMGVAYVMAQLQIVMPDVGFLFLDEPTTHMDPDGQEGLRDMLLNLRDHMQTGDMQVWVCDHAAPLKTAFLSRVELKAPVDYDN